MYALLAGLISLLATGPDISAISISEEANVSDTSSYETVFDALMDWEPDPSRIAAVNGLTITRDVATFQLNSGTMYLMAPVASKTVAAVFLGDGTFLFTPPNDVEREQLARFYETESLETPFNSLLLIFADSTLEVLEANLSFGAGEVNRDATKHVEYCLKYLSNDDSKYFDTSIMMTLLNNESNGLFYAHLSEKKDEPLIFEINPFSDEQVYLLHRAKEADDKETAEIVNQFRAQNDARLASDTDTRRNLIEIGHYRIVNTIGSNLDYSAETETEIVWMKPDVKWFPLTLFSRLEIDEALWDDGSPVSYFRGEKSSVIWINTDRSVPEGGSLKLILKYHGELIYNWPNDYWYVTVSPMFWYPWDRDGALSPTTFDVTFHAPRRLTIVSLGEKVESSEDNRNITTRWVASRPLEHTSFSLGEYNEYPMQPPGVPPLTVLITREPSRPLPRSGLSMQAQVGADIANSQRFYQDVFGAPLDNHTYAAEVWSMGGQAFAGMVHLSLATFFEERDDGADKVFRAHEIAHQWWGVAVNGRTYRDKWLTEGMSQFAAIWYLDVMLNERESCIDMLEEWRKDIFDRGDEAEPLWLGTRVGTSEHPEDYQLIVYNKGAWVLHMLRGLMRDEGLTSDRTFTTMMREFYNTNRGGKVTTEDFQEVVENHIGEEMDWFFDQWVYSNDLPTYEFATTTEHTADGRYKVLVKVAQQNVPDTFRMTVPVRIEFDNDESVTYPLLVTGAVTQSELPILDAEPKRITLNPDEAVLAEVKNKNWQDI